MEKDLLEPCGKCPTITDKETGYIAGTSVMLFKTFNGSSRYVYQVHGRNVAVILIQAQSSKLGRIVSAYTHPDYANSGLFRKLWYVASKDYGNIRLGDELANCSQVLDLVHEIKGV